MYVNIYKAACLFVCSVVFLTNGKGHAFLSNISGASV